MLTKSCPRWRGKWHEVPKGVRLKTAECRELFPLSLFAIAHRQLPRFTVAPFGAVQTRRTVPYPFAERSFQWGYGGCRGGLRGEIEIFPGPPAKRLYSNSQLFVYANPSVKPSVCQLPGRGAFWCALQLKHSHGGPPMTAPTTLHINFWNNQGDASRPLNFMISHAHPP